MALIEFKNKPNTTTPINATNLNYNFNEILNLIYPIGRGFIDFTDTDYSNYLGFTWERELVGLTPIGLDTAQTEFNEIGKTGGNCEHNHTLNGTGYAKISLTPYNSVVADIVSQNSSYNRYIEMTKTDSAGVTDTATNLLGTTGTTSNLPPYQVVAYWKRVA